MSNPSPMPSLNLRGDGLGFSSSVDSSLVIKKSCLIPHPLLFRLHKSVKAKNMLKSVTPRHVNAVSNLPCLHLTSLSCLQSEKRTSDVVARSEVRRRMSAGTRTPYFQHFWKPGSCYYSESLGRMTKSATDICEDFVLSHIDSVPVPSPKGVFTIGDYGTCDGSVSLRLMHRIIGHLRNKHGPDLKIQVLYEDLPTNDYNSLFKTIYGSTSYIHKFDNVFPLACGTSFYKQCVPDNTCDIIMSSFATHWLSDRSHTMSSTMSPWMSTSEEEMKAHHEASARDWQTFLLLRATELKQGGLLFVAQPSQNTKSSPAQPGEITECARDTWIHLNLTWKELYAGDIITREEFQSCNVPATFRSLQELKAPFENAATMSPVRQAGLKLV
ncbi:probable S-adenosylmethionine-dependent methyltransferase At5g38780 [Pomacea canaliculata]|uniref:probable S-adenosylmethionine-dependent methyltransferase At5g38780 n=1 Tax=Pomacea canaliculata TaxID=400727 RepID=UPI000D72EF53|nr:probable S-adenosylmethionine-dependent methyltransferase At5g38780 [Pomacea canaliculata]